MTSEVTIEDLVDSSTDWSSSGSDDSDLDELLNDDDTEMMLLLFGMKEYYVLRGGDTGSARLDEFSARQKRIQVPLLALYGAGI